MKKKTKKTKCSQARKSSSQLNRGPFRSLILVFFSILTRRARRLFVDCVHERASASANNCHQAVWDCSDDAVWTRLDRWSRWGMNSCRRGLADRTWSVTRLLWRDRYTLSCQRGNKHTTIYRRYIKASAGSFHPHLVFIFIWTGPFFHQFSTSIFETWHNSLSVTSVEQRPKEPIVSSRGLPEVQQREPGIKAGGPNPGAGGEAWRGGKVRRRPRVGSQDEVHRHVVRGEIWKVVEKVCEVRANCLGGEGGVTTGLSNKSLEVHQDIPLSRVSSFLASGSNDIRQDSFRV